jgi:hypothetical protein
MHLTLHIQIDVLSVTKYITWPLHNYATLQHIVLTTSWLFNSYDLLMYLYVTNFYSWKLDVKLMLYISKVHKAH